MEPAFWPGDVVWANPYPAVQIGDDCLFAPADFETNMLRQIRHLESEDEDSWTVRQYNPNTTYKLPKSQWPHCIKIDGKQAR
jgi:hypothetical protein